MYGTVNIRRFRKSSSITIMIIIIINMHEFNSTLDQKRNSQFRIKK